MPKPALLLPCRQLKCIGALFVRGRSPVRARAAAAVAVIVRGKVEGGSGVLLCRWLQSFLCVCVCVGGAYIPPANVEFPLYFLYFTFHFLQVPSNHRKFHTPPESPHDALSSRSPTDRHSSPPASESPHQLNLRQHRSPLQSPSPPLVSRKRDRWHSQSPSPPNNRRRRRSISKSPSRQRRRMLSNSPPMNHKGQRVPPDSLAQRRRRSSSPPPDRRGRGRPFHQSPPRSEGEWVEGGEAPPPKKKKEAIDPILTRTGMTIKTVTYSH